VIKTKSVYDPAEPTDRDRFLVSRYWPRGISKERLRLTCWLRELAPSVQLLRDWKDGRISWEEYTRRYHQEMSDQQDRIAELAERSRSATITLICVEREEDPHCHRHLLKGLIEAEK